MYGSRRDVLMGLLRALPDPESSALVRAVQTAVGFRGWLASSGRPSPPPARWRDVWALQLARRHPARVGRVVLLGGGPVVAECGVPRIIRLIASPIGALMVRLPQKPGRVRAIMRQAGHSASLDAGRIPDEYIRCRVALERETDSMRNERDMVRAVVSWRKGFRPGLTFEEPELAAIEQPTLLVYGTADPVGTVELWRRVVALLPSGELQLVDGAGHMPWLDNPSEVAERVRRFLAT